MIIDLFAGPGGWDEGLRLAGYDGTVVGFELDGDACATAVAAGHPRVRADVASWPLESMPAVDGLIASPPCQAFSLAGKGDGARATEALVAHVYACVDGWHDPPESLCADDVRADLTLQPLRWVWQLWPTWIACEQVPPVLPLWRAMASTLRAWGYEAEARILNAADYGVPQTRRRAFLVARRDGRRVAWPDPTHFDARQGRRRGSAAGGLLFGEPWVTMAQALGWSGDLAIPRGSGMTTRPVPRRAHPGDEPAPTVREKYRSAEWVGAGDASGDVRFVAAGVTGQGRPKDPGTAPADTLTGKGTGYWTLDRPATTVIGSSDQIAAPGHRCMSDDCCGRGPRRHFTEDSIRVTVEQASILQSFRPDYPWQGSRTSQYRQVGNAVPPVLAAAVLRPFLPSGNA